MTPAVRIERHLYGASAARDEAVASVIRAVFIGEGYSSPEMHGLFAPGVLASRGDTWVALAGDAVAGTVLLVSAGSRFRQVAVAPEAEIHLLAVAPAHRGRGAGEALISALVAHARESGVPALVLSSQSSMLAAHALYAKVGFTRAPHRDWIHTGRAFWVFERLLGASR